MKDKIKGFDPWQNYLHGAEFRQQFLCPTYYEVNSLDPVIAPWLAQKQEYTYMNRTKLLNEPEVLTYKDLCLTSIPENNYGLIEHFGYPETKDLTFKIFLIIFVLVLLVVFLMSL